MVLWISKKKYLVKCEENNYGMQENNNPLNIGYFSIKHNKRVCK